MKLATSWSANRDLKAAIATAYDALVASLGGRPSMLFMHFTANIDARELARVMRETAPGVPMHGGSSCLGVMTQAGFHSDKGFGLGLCGIADPEGCYGVGAAPLGDEPARAARLAVERALEQAGRPGAVPALVWMTAAPGAEEEVIRGIEAYLGPNVPIAGGSSADNTVSGTWKELANGEVHTGSVVITVLFPSTELYFSSHSGYEPTGKRGRVTRAEGRIVYRIDGRPAAEVYGEWAGEEVASCVRAPGNLFGRATLHPLGREVGTVAGVPSYQLALPERVLPGGALSLFATVSTGDELVLMTGTRESLIARAGRVAHSALGACGAEPEQLAGALVIYCAGCMLTVRERMDEVVRSLGHALGSAPFLGGVTFGEQGCLVGGANRHGNLMISVLVFTA